MISVIVPVYNCERYLDKGIRSLISQTIFQDLDIVFIDDGSTDRSGSIIQSYVDKYSNMRLISQTNNGVSSARNRGLEEARGTYVTFFDADDIAADTLYESLLTLIVENDADLSCVNYSKYFPDGIEKVQKEKIQTILTGEQIIKSFFSSNILCNNTVDKLFVLSVAREIKFPEGYAIGEDMFFVFNYLLKSQKIVVDNNKCLYQYCIRTNSAMKSGFSKKYFDTVDLSKKMMDMLSFDKSLYLFAEANWIHEICKTLALYYQSDCTKYRDEVMFCEKKIKSYPIKKANKYLSKNHFAALLIMRISPKLYIKIYNMLHIG